MANFSLCLRLVGDFPSSAISVASGGAPDLSSYELIKHLRTLHPTSLPPPVCSVALMQSLTRLAFSAILSPAAVEDFFFFFFFSFFCLRHLPPPAGHASLSLSRTGPVIKSHPHSVDLISVAPQCCLPRRDRRRSRCTRLSVSLPPLSLFLCPSHSLPLCGANSFRVFCLSGVISLGRPQPCAVDGGTRLEASGKYPHFCASGAAL